MNRFRPRVPAVHFWQSVDLSRPEKSAEIPVRSLYLSVHHLPTIGGLHLRAPQPLAACAGTEGARPLEFNEEQLLPETAFGPFVRLCNDRGGPRGPRGPRGTGGREEQGERGDLNLCGDAI